MLLCQLTKTRGSECDVNYIYIPTSIIISIKLLQPISTISKPCLSTYGGTGHKYIKVTKISKVLYTIMPPIIR